MASGFTYEIIENGTTFKQFALRCARAFVQEYKERELQNELDCIEVNYHYDMRRLEVISKIVEFKRTPEKELREQYSNLLLGNILSQANISQEKLDDFKKYEEMLVQVNNWEPPTKEHEDLKQFMITQLNDSMKNDCRAIYDKVKSFEINEDEFILWKLTKIKTWEEDVERLELKFSQELDHVRQTNTWIKNLKESLPDV